MTSENIILLREFKYNSIKIKDKIRISRFIPSDLKNLIETNVPKNNYILGVTYSTGESQICISGHPKDSESMEEGTCREMCEELCLLPKNNVKLESCYNDSTNYFYFLDIKSTYITTQSLIKKGKDLKNRSVVCVHGSLKDILCYMTKLKYDVNNEDNIDSIWSTSKENIMNYMNNKNGFLHNY